LIQNGYRDNRVEKFRSFNKVKVNARPNNAPRELDISKINPSAISENINHYINGNFSIPIVSVGS
jgi:hypothetical protein